MGAPRSGGLAAVCDAIAIAILMLGVGWGAGADALKRLRPGFAAMVPSTASCFIGSGVSLIWMLRGSPKPFAVRALALLVALVAVIDMIIYSFMGGRGIDHLFLPEGMGADAMAFATAASFLLASVCLAAMTFGSRAWASVNEICATIGFLAAAIAQLGYFFDRQAL